MPRRPSGHPDRLHTTSVLNAQKLQLALFGNHTFSRHIRPATEMLLLWECTAHKTASVILSPFANPLPSISQPSLGAHTYRHATSIERNIKHYTHPNRNFNTENRFVPLFWKFRCKCEKFILWENFMKKQNNKRKKNIHRAMQTRIYWLQTARQRKWCVLSTKQPKQEQKNHWYSHYCINKWQRFWCNIFAIVIAVCRWKFALIYDNLQLGPTTE